MCQKREEADRLDVEQNLLLDAGVQVELLHAAEHVVDQRLVELELHNPDTKQ